MTRALRAVTDSPGVTLGAAIDAYLDTMPHREQARTRRSYAATLARLAASLGPGRDLAAVTGERLAAWMTETHGTNAPPTWNRARDVLRSAWAYWAECGWVAEHPERNWPVQPRSVPKDLPKAIPAAVLDRLLGDRSLPVRDRCLFVMLAETAARISEILMLNAEDLDMANRRARVVRKGGAADTVVWSSQTAILLPRMLKGRRTGPLFTTSRKAPAGTPLADVTPDGYGRLSVRTAEHLLAGHTRDLPGGPFHPHQFRHTAATLAAEQGASTAMLQALGGWSSPKQVGRYARVSPDSLARFKAEHDPGRRR